MDTRRGRLDFHMFVDIDFDVDVLAQKVKHASWMNLNDNGIITVKTLASRYNDVFKRPTMDINVFNETTGG